MALQAREIASRMIAEDCEAGQEIGTRNVRWLLGVHAVSATELTYEMHDAIGSLRKARNDAAGTKHTSRRLRKRASTPGTT